ncbi:MAG: DUF721 domain-containing protein [Chitinophagales bacterium]|nr:DUF721 domain-containing protein [Chitinophagales bacterium]MDW8428510.1 DUF721 domain-containing protein [Chitinophagales bacterium]
MILKPYITFDQYLVSKNDYTIGEAVQLLIRQLGLEEKIYERQLRSQWASLFGPAFAKYTETISLRNKKLYLRVNSAPLRQEIWFNRSQLIARIHEAIAPGIVEEVVLF